MSRPTAQDVATRQLAAIALVRADLEGRADDAIVLANSSDPLTTAALAHFFALVIRQLMPSPHAFLDTMTALYTEELANASSDPL